MAPEYAARVHDATSPTLLARSARPRPPAAPAPPDATREEASSDEGPLLPVAETLPAGAWSLSSVEIALETVSYGVTSHLEASITFALPVGGTLAAAASVKYGGSLLDDRLRLAGLLAVGGADTNAGSGVVLLPLALADVCLSAGCRSYAGVVAGGLILPQTVRGQVQPLVFGAHAVVRLGRRLDLLAELDDEGVIGAIPNQGVATDLGETAIAALGLRLFGTRFAGQLELLHLLGHGASVAPAAIPWFSFTARL